LGPGNFIISLPIFASRRQDSGSPLVPDSRSKWSKSIYSCASAVKTTIKTVSFSYSGTQGLLKNLVITDIQDNTYSSEGNIPLWGIENTGNSYENGGINLVWGLVSPAYENHPNVSTVKQKSLYLTGYSMLANAGQFPIYEDNMPGSKFYAGFMETAWNVPGSGVDYSGDSNIALWARWQKLSQFAETISLIPNLIFTNDAASAVVGTKGALGPMNVAPSNLVTILVTPTVPKIKCHYSFAIPAFIAAFALLALAGIVLGVKGRRIERTRIHLRRVSPGRIFTAPPYPEPGVDTFILTGK